METVVRLVDGQGGRLTRQLVEELFWKRLANHILLQGEDSAVLPMESGLLAFTTDSFVVNPLFFPGGDIGKLAVYGTINDLTMAGAKPQYLSLGMIIEEGLPLSTLEQVVDSIAMACIEGEVTIVTGDTKVVERGRGDGIYINTSGIGQVRPGVTLDGTNIRPGDQIVVTGSIGRHGLAVLSQREGLVWETEVESDCAPLNNLLIPLLDRFPTSVQTMRDPTRGGLAVCLQELARQGAVGIKIWEDQIPITPQVDTGCEMLGIDPLYLANEGIGVLVIRKEKVDPILQTLTAHPLGRSACWIGEVLDQHPGLVRVQGRYGGERMIADLDHQLLPRIC